MLEYIPLLDGIQDNYLRDYEEESVGRGRGQASTISALHFHPQALFHVLRPLNLDRQQPLWNHVPPPKDTHSSPESGFGSLPQ